MILAENVCYTYRNGNNVLKNISFEIKKGEFIAIIGSNGSGKTTLLKHFNGLLKPTGGKMLVNGMDTRKTKTSRLAKYVGFLFQNPDHQIFCSTVYDEIAFGLKNISTRREDIRQRVKKAAEKLGLESLLDSNPLTLSKGQRQRVAFASILALETDIIVLDEPTKGQDYIESIKIMDTVRELNEQGKTIIMVTHDMELAALYAKRIIVLRNGTIHLDGRTESVMASPEILASSGLKPPQIYMLSYMFRKYGLFWNVHTVEDMFRQLLAHLEGSKNVSIG